MHPTSHSTLLRSWGAFARDGCQCNCGIVKRSLWPIQLGGRAVLEMDASWTQTEAPGIRELNSRELSSLPHSEVSFPEGSGPNETLRMSCQPFTVLQADWESSADDVWQRLARRIRGRSLISTKGRFHPNYTPYIKAHVLRLAGQFPPCVRGNRSDETASGLPNQHAEAS